MRKILISIILILFTINIISCNIEQHSKDSQNNFNTLETELENELNEKQASHQSQNQSNSNKNNNEQESFNNNVQEGEQNNQSQDKESQDEQDLNDTYKERDDQQQYQEQEQDNNQEQEQDNYYSQQQQQNEQDVVNMDIDNDNEQIQLDENKSNENNEDDTINSQSKNVDIIAMEIQQIQSLIELHKTKLQLLSNLRDNMLKNNITFQMLKKKVQINQQQQSQSEGKEEDEESIMSAKINNIYQTNTKKITMKSSKQLQFQQNTFLNRLNRKFTVESSNNNKINSIKYINTFSYKTNKEIKANQMVASLTNESNILIHDFSGDMATDPYTPGHKIASIAVSQMTEDVFVASVGDDFMIRIAKIENQKVKSQFSSEDNQFKYKMKTDSSIKLISLNKDISVQEQVKTFEYVQFKGHQKLFLIGDQEGFLHIYNKNGTFIAKEELSSERLPIETLQKVTPSIIFQTEKEIGFFNLNTLKKSTYACPVEENIIQEIRADPYSNSMLFGLTKNSSLIVYDFKNMEEYCRIREIFDFESQLQIDEDDQFNINRNIPQYNTFIPIKNFIVLMSNQSNKLRILNTTDILTDGIQDGFDIVLFDHLNMDLEQMQFIQQQKIYQGNYIILAHTINQQSSTSYSLYEILVPPSKDVDYLSQIRLPLIITAIVGVISYQLWKNFKQKRIYKKKGDKNDKYGFKNGGMDQFGSSGQQKSSKYSNETSQINQYKDKINQLSETTEQLLKNTSRLESKNNNKKNNNYNRLDDYDDDDNDDDVRDNFNYFQKNNSNNKSSNKNDLYDFKKQFQNQMEMND